MFLIVSILAVVPQCMSLLLIVGMEPNQGKLVRIRSEPLRKSIVSGPRHKRNLGVRFIISFIPVMLLLFAIAYIPLPKDFTPPDIMTSALSRLLILGTITLGVLSGFGAISNSWGFIPFLASSRYTLFTLDLRFLRPFLSAY